MEKLFKLKFPYWGEIKNNLDIVNSWTPEQRENIWSNLYNLTRNMGETRKEINDFTLLILSEVAFERGACNQLRIPYYKSNCYLYNVRAALANCFYGQLLYIQKS